MPIATYYMDSSSFTDASTLYLDEELTIVAPNGYYSNGSVSRYQLDGILLPEEVCPNCSGGVSSILSFFKYASGEFIFKLSVPISSDIIITYAAVTGYPDTICSLESTESDVLGVTPITIVAGAGLASEAGATPMIDSGSYTRNNYITIDGINLNDGDIITVGIDVVTISISNACNIYLG